MNATCANCRATFDQTHNWQKLCWSCWRAKKDAASAAATSDAWTEGYRAGRAAALRDHRCPQPPAHPTVDATLIRDAVRLCHPDRHPIERFDAANDVTVRLLALQRTLT